MKRLKAKFVRAGLEVLGKKYDSPQAQQELVDELTEKFGTKFWAKPGHEWKPGAILWSGEGAEMPDHAEAFDYYDTSSLYEMGVHRDLEKWSKQKGLYWEPHDPGTYIAYYA